MSNNINALREHLFDVLKGLKDGSLDTEKAKAINETAQVIVNTAKVEVDYLRVTEQAHGTGFIEAPKTVRALPEDRVRAIRANDPFNAKKIS